MRRAILKVRGAREAVTEMREGAVAAWKTGEYRGETFGWETVELMFRDITPERWRLLQRLQAAGASGMSQAELLRPWKRDPRELEGDLRKLEEIGLVESLEEGGLWVPFDEIEIDLGLSRKVA